MSLSLKQKAIVLIVYTAGCVAVGRFLSPEKVKIQKELVKAQTDVLKTDTAIKSNTNKDKRVEKTIVAETKPDGTKVVTTKIIEDNQQKNTTDTSNKTSNIEASHEDAKESKTIERSTSKTTVSAMAGLDALNPSKGLVYGGQVQRDLLGPINAGAFGLTNGTVGVSLGLSF